MFIYCVALYLSCDTSLNTQACLKVPKQDLIKQLETIIKLAKLCVHTTCLVIQDKPASGQVHHGDLISPIHKSPSTSRVLAKYVRM